MGRAGHGGEFIDRCQQPREHTVAYRLTEAVLVHCRSVERQHSVRDPQRTERSLRSRVETLRKTDSHATAGSVAPPRGHVVCSPVQKNTRGVGRSRGSRPSSASANAAACAWATRSQAYRPHICLGLYTGKGLLRGRIVIPIHNASGELIAYAGPAIDGQEPKYRFPAGFRKSLVLFNLHRAIATNGKTMIAVEGFFDTIAVHQRS